MRRTLRHRGTLLPGRRSLVPGALLLSLLLAPLAAPLTEARAAESLEWAVKATYMLKLIPFVEWPPEALRTGETTICVIGADPFGGLLDAAVAGERPEGRPVVVRRLPSVGAVGDCQIAYAGGGAGERVADILAALRGRPILTVTDGAPRGSGGMINFLRIEDRVRFEADEAAAVESGLRISSRLLSLAIRVRRRG